MLAADDMTALVAVRKIRDMAAEQKKTVGDLCMSGKVIYQERVVYRERERPTSREDHKAKADDFADRFKDRTSTWDERERARKAARDAEEAAAREKRRQAYGSAFDDAEMSDEEREARRQRRNSRKSRFNGARELLDGLVAAGENAEQADLTYWEIEFCQTVPFQYEFDWELSGRQTDVAKRIIKKFKTNQGESPI